MNQEGYLHLNLHKPQWVLIGTNAVDQCHSSVIHNFLQLIQLHQFWLLKYNFNEISHILWPAHNVLEKLSKRLAYLVEIDHFYFTHVLWA